jgi:hypothetical protein
MQKFSRATPVLTKARSRVMTALAMPVLLVLLAPAVQAAQTSFFTITATPPTVTAGTSFTFTVTAIDVFNAVATGYTGTVHFTSTDGIATLPADYTFTTGAGGDNGVHVFSATLKTAGNQTITATDTATTSITGMSNTIVVTAGAATHFLVTAPATANAGTAFNFTVTALDQFNNTATSYGGTVHFTSTDGAATLPVNATLTNGVGTFSATLRTNGNQTITATDTVTGSITGTSNTILVDPPGGSAVPTLSQWNLALLGILMAGLAMWSLKARPGAGAA